MPKSPDLVRLGTVIRGLRHETGLSQEALAEAAHLHRTYVGGIERGERNVSFVNLARILGALESTWAEFAKRLDSRA